MTKCTISVTNNSEVDRPFFIYAGGPCIDNGEFQVLANVFLMEVVGGGKTGTFSFYSDVYAVCGSSGNGDQILISDSTGPVSLGGTAVKVHVHEGTMKFDYGPVSPTPAWDSFGIVTGSDFNPGGFVIGIRHKDTNSKVIPVPTTFAEPAITTTIMPSNSYHVAIGMARQTDIVHCTDATKVDFPSGVTTASVTYDGNGR